MFTPAERAQLRAALTLWQETMKNSRIHPADIPACKTTFIVADTLPLSDEKLSVLMSALEIEQAYITVPQASQQYHIAKHRLRRELVRTETMPVPGSKVYSFSSMLYVINRIRERDQR